MDSFLCCRRREEPSRSVSKTGRFYAESVTCRFTLRMNTPLSMIGSFSLVLNFLLLLHRKKPLLLQTPPLILFLTFRIKKQYLYLPPSVSLVLKRQLPSALAAYRSI
ncbi:hypothetical protein VIGAN_03287600 [Vigna angularis var. angularis]|uniref:Uncharacterized protein n=1 Tax=Vigna angularis var. angularis TaxID=157739 RepID=A0A0S3RQI6_PHAAN|nr:hypothetical protein VIGAN_03287600 [Vigna angularis var. angularis]